MSPPLPMSVLLYKCWLNRLEDCCQYCGELQTLSEGEEVSRSHGENNNAILRQKHNEKHDSCNTTNKSVSNEEHNHQSKSGWSQWENRKTQRKIKGGERSDPSTPVRLVYPRKSFNRIQKEAEVLLWQLPFPACFELVDDVTDDDEESDMMADLMDAYKLHEKSMEKEQES